MNKIRTFLAVVMLFAGLAAACGPAATPQPPTQEPESAPPTSAPSPEPTMPSEVVIGVVWPLTGSAAAMGVELQEGAELAAEIINGVYDLDYVPFASEAGIPNLGGAKIRIVYGDHQGDPEIGRAEAERLITEENVDAMIGAFYSSVTATVGQVCDREQVPLLNASSSSPTLDEMGFKWWVRLILDDQRRGESAQLFLDDLEEEMGLDKQSVAVLYENTLFGTDVGRYSASWAMAHQRNLVAAIPFVQGSPDFISEIQRLIAADPDVVISAAASDAITIVRTSKEMDFNPSLWLGASGQWNSTPFLETLGKDAEYVMTMGYWAPDLSDTKPIVGEVAELFRETYGHDLVERSALSFTAMMVMADALNRAGTANNVELMQALRETDIPGDQIILPWEGIRFDALGRSELAVSIMLQVFDGQYYTVWPFEYAAKEVVYPVPKWSER
jgi:branched-chain amino acid transport system substrate-binding protein